MSFKISACLSIYDGSKSYVSILLRNPNFWFGVSYFIAAEFKYDSLVELNSSFVKPVFV